MITSYDELKPTESQQLLVDLVKLMDRVGSMSVPFFSDEAGIDPLMLAVMKVNGEFKTVIAPIKALYHPKMEHLQAEVLRAFLREIKSTCYVILNEAFVSEVPDNKELRDMPLIQLLSMRDGFPKRSCMVVTGETIKRDYMAMYRIINVNRDNTRSTSDQMKIMLYNRSDRNTRDKSEGGLVGLLDKGSVTSNPIIQRIARLAADKVLENNKVIKPI